MVQEMNQPYLSLDLENIIRAFPFKDGFSDIKLRWFIGRRMMQENVILKDSLKSKRNKKSASLYLFLKFGDKFNFKSLMQYERFFNQYLNLDKEFHDFMLSWNSYVILMKIKEKEIRHHFEKEALNNHWNEKQLLEAIRKDRRISSSVNDHLFK